MPKHRGSKPCIVRAAHNRIKHEGLVRTMFGEALKALGVEVFRLPVATRPYSGHVDHDDFVRSTEPLLSVVENSHLGNTCIAERWPRLTDEQRLAVSSMFLAGKTSSGDEALLEWGAARHGKD